jgi:heptosyltransferase-3
MYAPYNNNSAAINTNTDSLDDYIAILDKILK